MTSHDQSKTHTALTPAAAAVVLLNDTFPNPLFVLVALAAFSLPVIVVSWTAVRLVRKQPIPWPSPILAIGLFVGLFLLAILADVRFPSARALESLIGAIATPLVFPGLMLAGPLGLLDPAHPTS